MRYRFGAYVLDPGRRMLEGPEGAVHLRPRALDLLVLLVERAPEVVTHREALDKVWGVEHLSPQSLSQAICEIRQALGEDARNPRMVVTVHRTGYRFAAPVIREAAPPRPRRRPRARRTPLAGLGLAALVAALGVLLTHDRPAAPPPAVTVTCSSVDGGAPPPWGETLASRLREGLADPLPEGMPDPGSSFLPLSVHLAAAPRPGGGVRLVARIVSASGLGSPPVRIEAATPEELLSQSARLADRLREQAGLLALRTSVRREDAFWGWYLDHAHSLPAAQSFLAGLRWALAGLPGHARRELEAAGRTDEAFWPAFLELARLAWDQGRRDDAGALLDRARRLAGADPVGSLVLAEAEALTRADSAAGVAAARALAREFPESPAVRLRLVMWLYSAGKGNEAEPVLDELLESPAADWPRTWTVAIYTALQSCRWGRARRLGEQALVRHGDMWKVALAATFALQAAGAAGEAQRAAGRTLCDCLREESCQRRLLRAPAAVARMLHALAGEEHREEDRALFAAVLEIAEREKAPHRAENLDAGLQLLWANLEARKWRRMAELLNEPWARDSSSPWIPVIRAWAELGMSRREGARSQLPEVAARWARATDPVAQGFVAYENAALHAALGEDEAALRWLAKASPGHRRFLVLCDPALRRLRSDPRLRRILDCPPPRSTPRTGPNRSR